MTPDKKSNSKMIELILRPYQTDLVAAVSAALKRCRRVLLQAPTGAGKTAIAAHLLRAIASSGRRVYFVCHRVELLTQTSLTLKKYGIEHGFIAAGYPTNLFMSVQVCSIDTLKNRIGKIHMPDFVIWDECHHLGAAGWRSVMDAFNTSRHIGLTATPWRLDGSGFREQFDDIVLGPSSAELIAGGSLSDYRMFVPHGGMDVSGVGKRAGDFIAKEIEAKQNKPKLIGDMIAHWRKHANDNLSIGFAPSVAFSEYMAEQFNQAGIPSAHLDGNTDERERRRTILAYADRKILVLWNKGLFGEGFDIAAWAQRDIRIGCLIDAAPSQSLSSVMQRWGRVLRPGDDAIILDHAGNSNRHGFPDDEREWSLDGWKDARPQMITGRHLQ
jgi:DNA repair protein RadD